MKQYRTLNNLFGWIVFLIAALVYCMTIESTASFWDCGEFITSGYKLEVGHPPGAPFFMLTANFFTQFVGDASLVARMVNYMSALMSAACILFLFWSITHLVKKLVITDEENISPGQSITVIGSGLLGALVYTFSDTFWFSAVEGEVYAYSSLFTAVVFWLILKWEEVADQPHSDRWIILISYLTGLSIGVHLLNLLCLPAIVLIYYYKKNPQANVKESLLALLGSAVLVVAVLYGIVPGVVKVGGWFELLFVNGMGLPFNTGVIVYIVALTAVIIWSVYESYVEKNRKRMNLSFLVTFAMLGIPFYGYGVSSIVIGLLVLFLLGVYLSSSQKANKKYKVGARTMNTALLCVMMIMVGYSSYALIVIRSIANTPMDQNSPEDIFTLGEYLGREQYGTRPLFYGPTYASQVTLDVKDGYCEPRQKTERVKYIRKEKQSPNEKDQYVQVSGHIEYEYAQNMLFPRMYSSTHAKEYEHWVRIKGHNAPYDRCGENIMVKIPTQWENIKFLFTYQLNYMYWRYFMWNFAGRQNDAQGNGGIENGNWVTGIPFIDDILIGSHKMPKEMDNNKGHNVYYCLPLLLGIVGLFWQSYRGKKGIRQFWVVFFLFFMTGIAIILYLNQTPTQPRERDYAYAGSFYAFAIWIGMGMAGITQLLRNYCKLKELPAAIASLVCLLVPVQMAGQTWDDHNRSGRYVCRDFGQNYLMSTQESGNPVIFTNGDNDTFPLWYNLETEEFRTDVRTCNLSYLQTDWYIDQMKRPAYNSPALPITWNHSEYKEGTNEYVPVHPEYKKQIDEMYGISNTKDRNAVPSNVREDVREAFGDNPYELKNILNYWVRSKNKDLRMIPTDSMVVKIDKEAVRRSGMMIPAALGDSIPEYMHISLKGKRALYKSELMMLEMLANANWERPLYIAISVGPENQLGMTNHFIQEGLAYRFTPFDIQALKATVDSQKMYDNLMNKFKFGGIDKPNVYLDENVMRMCHTHRRLFALLAAQLLEEGKNEQALKVLDYCEQVIPDSNVPHNNYLGNSLSIAEAYYQLGKQEKGDKIAEVLFNNSLEYVTWYFRMNDRQLAISIEDAHYHLYLLNEYKNVMDKYESKLAPIYTGKLNTLNAIYNARVNE
ncbi:hypothetical protein EZS27_020187 [termite gut metagenome]|uniref:DUF2723 domain-containing protein n=1 Tax=termite gut metagenome TaxID=433724 RepID=A0A5J4RED1_9ZZZZ